MKNFCNYRKAKQKFLDANLSVTNFPYLMTESNYNGKIKPRQLLIIDEAHNVEAELSRFIEVSVSEKFLKSQLKNKKIVLWVTHNETEAQQLGEIIKLK